MPTEVLLLFALILVNGVFAMSEIALVTARRARLQALVEQGDAGAAAAIALNDEPTRFLSTIQVGITSIGILSGIVGEAALRARRSADWLIGLGAEAKGARFGATALVVVVVTYFSIVLGELVPKRLGQISRRDDRAPRRPSDRAGWRWRPSRSCVCCPARPTCCCG